MSAEYPRKKMTAARQERICRVLQILSCLLVVTYGAGTLWFDWARPVRGALLALAIALLAVGLVFLCLSRRRRQ